MSFSCSILILILILNFVTVKATTRTSLKNLGSDCKASCVFSCPAGWEREGDRCYFFSQEEKSWHEAEETCVEKHRGHLASVPSEQVHQYLQRKKIRDFWIGGVKEDFNNPVNEDSKWVWTDCSEWEFNEGWAEEEPNSGPEKCVEYFIRNLWNNGYCENENKFVCSKKVCPERSNYSLLIQEEHCQSGDCVEPNCSSGWEERDGQCYYWSQEKLFWGAAEEKCRSLGSHLVSVTSQDVHDYLYQNENNPGGIWIGATDQEEEGNWKWTDCNPWSFQNWGVTDDGTQQPDNNKYQDGDGQNCVVLPGNNKNETGWNDVPCNTRERHFVCAKPICSSGLALANTLVIAIISSVLVILCIAVLACFIFRRLKSTQELSVTNLEKEDQNLDYGTYYYDDGNHRINVMEATDTNTEYGFMEDSDTQTKDRNSQYGYN